MPPSTSSKKRSTETSGASAADLPRPNGPRKIVEVITDADVLLEVGDGVDALDIKASSAILKASSKVFKAMVESSFIEGTSKVAELKEVNPQAILDLCYITHHRADKIVEVNAYTVRRLMAVTEMLETHQAVKPWMMMTLANFIRWVDEVSAYPAKDHKSWRGICGWRVQDGVTFAAVFRMQELFWKTTRAYLATSYRLLPAAQLPVPPISSGDLTIYSMFPICQEDKNSNEAQSFLKITEPVKSLNFSRKWFAAFLFRVQRKCEKET